MSLAEGPVCALWPGSALHAIQVLAHPRWEDFTYEASNSNRFGWVGNGWSKEEVEGGDTVRPFPACAVCWARRLRAGGLDLARAALELTSLTPLRRLTTLTPSISRLSRSRGRVRGA